MKYAFLTLQYLFRLDNGKRLLTLFLFALPSCVLLAWFFPITGYFEWLFGYTGAYSSYSELWLSLVQRDTVKIGLLFAAYLLLVLSISAITTISIKSMRVGKFQMSALHRLINENFFPSLFLVTAILLALLALQSLLCLFLFMWQHIPSKAAAFSLSMVSFFASLAFLAYVFSLLVLWLPIMSINGQKPFRALETSVAKTHKNKKSMYLGYLLPVGIVLLGGLLSYFFRAVGIVKLLINIINYSFVTVYYCIFSLVAYFETEGITREDLTKRPYLRR